MFYFSDRESLGAWGKSMIRAMLGRQIGPLLLSLVSVLASRCHCQDQAELWAIAHVLKSGHLSGSMEYWGRCGDEKQYITRGFPTTTVSRDASAPPLRVLRETFAGDDVLVTQDPDGTIRLVEKGVPQDLLNVKIEHISFDDEQKKRPNSMYFETLVLDFITKAPEVLAFMKDHRIGLEPKLIKRAVNPHPDFSGELNSVTLSQALDYMLKTFQGLWVNNEKLRVVDFSFYPAN